MPTEKKYAGLQFEYLVFIGRFQPFHFGHYMAVQKALKLAAKVIILIGSAEQAPTIKDPWTYRDRKRMIMDSFRDHEISRIVIRPLVNSCYNNTQWITQVQSIVDTETSIDFTLHGTDGFPKGQRVGIIGHYKDISSKYLDWFPQWKLVEVDNVPLDLSATEIRELYFSSLNLSEGNIIQRCVPYSTLKVMEEFNNTKTFLTLLKEYQFIKEYKQQWANSPYPPVFVTADAVVECAGHILLVKRGAMPGEGLLALPGGFIKQDESIEDAAFRELREETKIKVPEPVLRGSLKNTHVFDHPERSLRGRTITHAFHIKLEDMLFRELPKVKGSDDATKARWYDINFVKMNRSKLFEDHFDIINYFLGTS